MWQLKMNVLDCRFRSSLYVTKPSDVYLCKCNMLQQVEHKIFFLRKVKKALKSMANLWEVFLFQGRQGRLTWKPLKWVGFSLHMADLLHLHYLLYKQLIRNPSFFELKVHLELKTFLPQDKNADTWSMQKFMKLK